MISNSPNFFAAILLVTILLGTVCQTSFSETGTDLGEGTDLGGSASLSSGSSGGGGTGAGNSGSVGAAGSSGAAGGASSVPSYDMGGDISYKDAAPGMTNGTESGPAGSTGTAGTGTVKANADTAFDKNGKPTQPAQNPPPPMTPDAKKVEAAGANQYVDALNKYAKNPTDPGNVNNLGAAAKGFTAATTKDQLKAKRNEFEQKSVDDFQKTLQAATMLKTIPAMAKIMEGAPKSGASSDSGGVATPKLGGNVGGYNSSSSGSSTGDLTTLAPNFSDGSSANPLSIKLPNGTTAQVNVISNSDHSKASAPENSVGGSSMGQLGFAADKDLISNPLNAGESMGLMLAPSKVEDSKPGLKASPATTGSPLLSQLEGIILAAAASATDQLNAEVAGKNKQGRRPASVGAGSGSKKDNALNLVSGDLGYGKSLAEPGPYIIPLGHKIDLSLLKRAVNLVPYIGPQAADEVQEHPVAASVFTGLFFISLGLLGLFYHLGAEKFVRLLFPSMVKTERRIVVRPPVMEPIEPRLITAKGSDRSKGSRANPIVKKRVV